MENYYLQPKYYSEFHCTGGDCPINCCFGWRIDWTEEDYNRLVNAELTDELRSLCDKSFEKHDYYHNGKVFYMVKFANDGFCPFLERESGLCKIQKYVGEKYLSTVCITYPRRVFKREHTYFRSCNTSCVHIIEMLLNDRHSTVLERRVAYDASKIKSEVLKYDTVEIIEKIPCLRYRMQILDFYSVLFNSGLSVENAVIIGALAAKHLSDSNGKEDDIKEIIDRYKNQSENSDVLRSLENISPNYRIKYVISNNIINSYFKDRAAGLDLTVLVNGGEFIVDKYLMGKQRFEDAFEKENWFLSNIITNLFYEIFMHMDIDAASFFDIYMLFTAYVSLIQILAYSIGYSSERIRNEFVLSLADLSRGLAHGEHRAADVLKFMKELGLVSLAHLALIIK